MSYTADAGYPDGLGGSNDLSLRQVSNKLVKRTIVEVLFEDGRVVLRLDNGTTVVVAGNGQDDNSVRLAIDERKSEHLEDHGQIGKQP